MDNSLEIDVARSLFQLISGQALKEPQLQKLSSYFSGYGSFSAKSFPDAAAGNQQRYLKEALRQSDLAEQWQKRIISPRLRRREAEQFIRALLQNIYRKRSEVAHHWLICGETITEQHSILDYPFHHSAKGQQWVFHLTTEGTCLLSDEDHRLINEGELLVIPPNYLGQYQRAPSCPRWAHFWLRFTALPQWLEWCPLLLDRDQPAVIPIKEASLPATRHVYKDIMFLQDANRNNRDELISNRIECLLMLLTDPESGATKKPMDHRIQKAAEYITRHYNKDWSVIELAKHCHLSAARLSALFKQQLGLSPMQWRDQLRIQEAKRLLISTRESIAMISLHVGYTDQLHFSRRFRHLAGVSPRQFRQQH